MHWLCPCILKHYLNNFIFIYVILFYVIHHKQTIMEIQRTRRVQTSGKQPISTHIVISTECSRPTFILPTLLDSLTINTKSHNLSWTALTGEAFLQVFQMSDTESWWDPNETWWKNGRYCSTLTSQIWKKLNKLSQIYGYLCS